MVLIHEGNRWVKRKGRVSPREGIHDAIAARVASMVARIPVQDLVMLTGGVARNAGVAWMLEEKLGHTIVVTEHAQLAGAIGAALIARE